MCFSLNSVELGDALVQQGRPSLNEKQVMVKPLVGNGIQQANAVPKEAVHSTTTVHHVKAMVIRMVVLNRIRINHRSKQRTVTRETLFCPVVPGVSIK